MQRQVDPAQQVGSEKEGAVGEDDGGERLTLIGAFDFGGETADAFLQRRFVEEDLFELILRYYSRRD